MWGFMMRRLNAEWHHFPGALDPQGFDGGLRTRNGNISGEGCVQCLHDRNSAQKVTNGTVRLERGFKCLQNATNLEEKVMVAGTK